MLPDHLLIRFAGTLWFLAGVFYLASESIAALAFPGYSYAQNYVSDLGVPYPDMSDGRLLHSGLAQVMNIGGFILDGLLFAGASVAAFLVIRERGRPGIVFLLLALIHSVGTILVGVVHSGSREVAAGIHHYHVIGAGMAIVGGNLAIIAASVLSRRIGAPGAYGTVSSVLGAFGLLSVATLEMKGIAGLAVLPDGILERCSIYPITIWEVFTGLALLCSPSFSRAKKILPPT